MIIISDLGTYRCLSLFPIYNHLIFFLLPCPITPYKFWKAGYCQNFSNQQNGLFDDLNSINSEILKMSENEIVQVLLFGNKGFSKDMNFRIITSSIRFIKDSKRFDESLSSWEKPFWYIFTTGIKIRKYFFTFCISVLCNLSAVKSSKV